MKKWLMILLISFISIPLFSETMRYRAFSCALADVNPYTHVYTWGSFLDCNIEAIIDTDLSIVTIATNPIQQYRILSDGVTSIDNGGGQQVSFNVKDQDGDFGTLRIRLERNGNLQLYIDFYRVAWVYNIYRIN